MQPLVGVKESEEIVVKRVGRRLERFLSEREKQRRDAETGAPQFAETPGGHGDSEGTRPRFVAFPPAPPAAARPVPPAPARPTPPAPPTPTPPAPPAPHALARPTPPAPPTPAPPTPAPPAPPALARPTPPAPLHPATPAMAPPQEEPRGEDEFFPRSPEQRHGIPPLPPPSRPGSTAKELTRSVTAAERAPRAVPASPPGRIDIDQTRPEHANIPASPPPPAPESRSGSLAAPMRDTSIDAPEAAPASLAGLGGTGEDSSGDALFDSPASQIFVGDPATDSAATRGRPFFAAPSFYVTLLMTFALLLLAYHFLLGPEFLG